MTNLPFILRGTVLIFIMSSVFIPQPEFFATSPSLPLFGCELLMVTPVLRGQGIGSALLAALQQQCRTAKLFTSVNTSNTGMQALLLRQGFVLSGQVDNLDDGDPELFYFRKLSCKND